jgi:hypothetical protein
VAIDPNHPLLATLDSVEPKPQPRDSRDEKKNYAQRLSNGLAQLMADALRADFPTITPTVEGAGQESAVAVDKGNKRLDVKVTDEPLGLILNVSIKTYSFQDYSPKNDRLGRWTKNIVRNDLELRGEAMVLHQRQPYSVLVGLMFEPLEICDDGDPERASDAGKSSFAHHVSVLSKRSGRGGGPSTGERPAPSSTMAPRTRDMTSSSESSSVCTDTTERIEGPSGSSTWRTRLPATAGLATPSPLTFDALIGVVKEEVNRRNSFAPTWDDPSVDEDD